MTDLRITGPNSDGEYWLHIAAGGKIGGVNLGTDHGPMVKGLLDAAVSATPPAQEPVAHWYTGPTEEQATAALRAKLAEAERELTLTQEAYDAAVDGMRKAEADRDEERKLADDLARAFRATLEAIGPDAVRSNALDTHAARRKE